MKNIIFNMKFIYNFSFLLLILYWIIYCIKTTSNLGIFQIIGKIYYTTKNIVNVKVKGGLGNRLMSFAGIILLSIFFKSKPISIFKYISN